MAISDSDEICGTCCAEIVNATVLLTKWETFDSPLLTLVIFPFVVVQKRFFCNQF
jgi:hypothetical protein